MNFLGHATFLIGLISPLVSFKGVAAFTACIDDRPWIPYTHPDPGKPGNMQILVSDVGDELNVRVDIQALPWKRCLESVKVGRIDAAIGASDLPYIRSFARFPESPATRTTDHSRSLGTARVMLAKKVESEVEWDGTTLAHVKKPIGTALGTLIMSQKVMELGGTADDTARTDEQNIKKVLQDRIDLMAAYEYDLKEILRKAYRGKIHVFPTPLVESHYHLAFSKKFYEKNVSFVETFWKHITVHQEKALIQDDFSRGLAPMTHASRDFHRHP